MQRGGRGTSSASVPRPTSHKGHPTFNPREERRDAFRRLVRLPAVHETAEEEEVVRPFARKRSPGGEQVVKDRLAGEKAAKETLSALDDMDTDDPTFMPRLLKLRKDVQEHARAEERYEFTHIRRSTDATNLASMAKAIKAAEAMAPTRAPPGCRVQGQEQGPRSGPGPHGPHQGRRPQGHGQGLTPRPPGWPGRSPGRPGRAADLDRLVFPCPGGGPSARE